MNYLRMVNLLKKKKRFIYLIILEAASPNSMILALARPDLPLGDSSSHL
jgi:hypothetical protein